MSAVVPAPMLPVVFETENLEVPIPLPPPPPPLIETLVIPVTLPLASTVI